MWHWTGLWMTCSKYWIFMSNFPAVEPLISKRINNNIFLETSKSLCIPLYSLSVLGYGHQDTTGRLTPCLSRSFAVFNKSMRRKSRTDYLLMKQCSRVKTRTGQYNVRTLYQKGRLAQLNKIMGE